jgi:predicted DNA-binding transcriptional regulator AlpA
MSKKFDDEAIARHRVMNSTQTAAFVGKSIPQLNRLVRAGKFPKPFKIGERDNGWTVGMVIDHIDQCQAAAA